MRMVAIAMLGLTLAACDGGKAPATNTAAAAATPDPTEAKMLAATDAQRKVAFLRGILDSEYPCNKVTKVDNRPRDPEGHLVWQVTCDVARDYTVTLMPGGIFYVSGVPGGEIPKDPAGPAKAAPAPSGR